MSKEKTRDRGECKLKGSCVLCSRCVVGDINWMACWLLLGLVHLPPEEFYVISVMVSCI